jgi:hypothetical protein
MELVVVSCFPLVIFVVLKYFFVLGLVVLVNNVLSGIASSSTQVDQSTS